jgi:hypothetical protein
VSKETKLKLLNFCGWLKSELYKYGKTMFLGKDKFISEVSNAIHTIITTI